MLADVPRWNRRCTGAGMRTWMWTGFWTCLGTNSRTGCGRGTSSNVRRLIYSVCVCVCVWVGHNV